MTTLQNKTALVTGASRGIGRATAAALAKAGAHVLVHYGRSGEGLFNLIKAAPPSLRYEPGVILAERDYVIVHGRFSNIGLPVNWIAADVVRLKDGILVEHWDVIQDEATSEQSKSGNPMFGDSFAK